MMEGKRVVIVMPAYNASKTLERTHQEVLAHDTVERARTLPRTTVEVHSVNRGYGANQKSCYALALKDGADVVVMVHPDYQYTPKLHPARVCPIDSDLHDSMRGSRILGGRSRYGG